MTLYAFATKTVFDPSKGLSIRAFSSKTEYLKAAPIKFVSVAALLNVPDAPVVIASIAGDDGARTFVQNINEQFKTGDVLISHTDFHKAAVEIRSGNRLTMPVVLVDELARKHNPALKSVSLDKLHALYGPHNIRRPQVDLIEGQHGEIDVQALNEVDAAIMLHLYEHITREINQTQAAAN